MALLIQEATRKRLKLRMAICGPAKSGKTFTSLRFAFALAMQIIEDEVAAGRPRRLPKILVIDSENQSAAKYVGESPDGYPWKFHVIELQGDFSPSTYTAAIELGESKRYDVIIADSLSHAWNETLNMVDRNKGRSKFTDGWKEASPLHNALVEKIVGCSEHLICTMRAKTEYVLEQDEKGRTVPRKMGMAPVQRNGIEFEFDIVCDVDQDNVLTVSGSRCTPINGKRAVRPGPEFVAPIVYWLQRGSNVPGEIIAAANLMDVDKFVPAGSKPASEPPAADPKELAKQAAEKRRAKTAAPSTDAGNVVVESAVDTIADTAAILDATRNEIFSLAKAHSIPPDVIVSACQRRGGSRLAELTEVAGQDLLRSIHGLVARTAAENARREELGFVGDAAPPASETPPFI